MTEALAVLLVLATIFALLLRGRGHAFRPRLAQTRVRRFTGPNLASVLAVVGIASLLLEAATSSPLSRVPGMPPLMVGIVVVLIMGIVIARSLTELVVAMLGLGLLVTTLGISGAITLVMIVALMLWLLGAARGFFA